MNIPKHWQYISFTEILDIIGGSQPAKEEFIANFQQGYIRLLQIRDFGDKPVPTFVKMTNKLRFCDKDDILIARYGASIGRILTGMSGAYNVAIVKVIIPQPLNKKFIYYFLKSNDFQQYITSNERAAINGFNKEDLNNFQIPVAPLKEQTEIVSILDEIFEKFETAKKQLAKIPRLLERYRQSVLERAVSGELTEDWREENNVEFFVKEDMLGTVIDSIDYGTSSALNTDKKGFPIIRIPNIGTFVINLQDLKYAELSENEYSKIKLELDDILVIRSNGSIKLLGKSAIVTEKEYDLGFAGYLLRLKPKKEVVIPKFLNLTINSNLIRNQIEQSERSVSGVNNINASEIKSLKINIFPLPEQTEIVNRVEKLLKKADEAEAKYKQAMKMIDKLQASVLAMAFRGELSEPQANDEPVSVLLEKIKIEKSRLEQERKALQKTQNQKKRTMGKIKKEKKSIVEVLKNSAAPELTVEECYRESGQTNPAAFFKDLRNNLASLEVLKTEIKPEGEVKIKLKTQ